MRPEQLLRKVFPPMLATLASDPPADDASWTYEMKYDGFRALTAIVNGRIAMWSRNELDLAPRFPHIADAMGTLALQSIPDLTYGAACSEAVAATTASGGT